MRLLVPIGLHCLCSILYPSFASGIEWSYFVGNLDDRQESNSYDARLFKEMVETSDTPIVRRECPSCVDTHKEIFYRRFTPMPDDFDLLDVLMNNWFESNNTFNVDFSLYSSYDEAVQNVSRWELCNFDARNIGFPRDCGPSRYVGGQWNTYMWANGGKKHAFYVPTNSNFESQLTNIARNRPVRQSETVHGGVAERAIDGNTVGIWNWNTVTHTNYLQDPYWEVNLEHQSTIKQVYIWSRLDCCQDRLSNVQVDVLDKPYGEVVATRTIEGQAKQMNAVDFGTVTGEVVRITLKTGEDKQYMSLAEVEVEGTLDGPPRSNPFLKVQGVDYWYSSGIRNVGTGAVGYFNNGDYMTYTGIDFGSAGTTKSILLEHSKGNRGGTMEIRIDGADGELIGTFSPVHTGGWDRFKTASISVGEVDGVHDVTFVGKDANGVLDVMSFELTDSWSFSINTDYRVDDNNGDDIQCTYDVVKDAFTDQIFNSNNGNTYDTAEEEFFHILGVTNKGDAEDAVYNLCGDAQKTVEEVPFQNITYGLGSQFVEVHYTGHGPWNEQTETLLYPSDGDVPAQVLKEDAATVNEYYRVSRSSVFEFPDLQQFDPAVCESHAAQCCWPRDRQANDNNGNCATPYDENCVDKDVADNTDLCYNELGHAPYANHIEADGFSVFDDEGPIHCHGFAWSTDKQETLSRYRGNALFFVSMYDHMHNRGYVENVPGSPMCGCVEHMPVVTRSDCTQTNVEETFTFKMSSGSSDLTGTVDRINLKYQSCQGANNRNNDLEAFVQQLVTDGKLTSKEQNILKTRIIGRNQCKPATEELLTSKGFKSGYNIDSSKWTYIVGYGFEDAGEPMYDARLFKEMVEALEIPIVRRVCTECTSSHKDIYYRRLTTMPEDFDLLDTLMSNWFDTNNAFNEDFALYSSYVDAYFDTNRWQECNFNHARVGFPRDCGPTRLIGGQWNTYFWNTKKHAFLLPANPSFKSQLSNIARGKPAYQTATAHGGIAERALDGNTVGIWNWDTVTHTNYLQNPYWEVNLMHDSTVNKVFFWNRLDCCQDRLSNVRIDVIDKPYGDVVASRFVKEGKSMNMVDFGGASGQLVRITLETGEEKMWLSLAEVEVEGTLDGSPISNHFLKVEGFYYTEQKGTWNNVATGAVGSLDNGDYLTYSSIDFGPSGMTKSILLNHSKGNRNGKVEVRLNGPDGQLISTFTPTYTGGWDKFMTTSLSISEVEGVHDLTFVAKDARGVLDLKWFELTDSWSFSIATNYKVNDNGGSDVQCDYDLLKEAFTEQKFNSNNGNEYDDAEQEFFHILGVSDEGAAKDAVYNLCGKAQKNTEEVPFERITYDQGSQFIKVFYTGHASWNEETETLLFPSDGENETQVLKEDAANVATYYEISRESVFKLPDLPQFDPTVCKSHAAQCCWPRDRQANDNNGNCATPYDENCVDKDVADNTDLCYNELGHAPYANHIEADGFTVFDEEGPIHCHGFAWSNDEQETLSRYKGNALFFVSMYDHMHNRGYVENVPGSPMCGCVEHMPVVSRSDCTQTNVQEHYTFTMSPDSDALDGIIDRMDLQYQSCQGANNRNNDLEAYVQQLVNDEKLTTNEQDIFKTRIIGRNQCKPATEKLLENSGFKRGYDIDDEKWTYIISIGHEDAGEPMYDARLFKEMVEALEVPIVRRVCTECSNSHQDIYYRRLTTMPEDFDLLDTLMNNWFDTNNAFNEDFALYSSYVDAYFDTNRWQACNFNHAGIGFPRDCGPTRLIGGQWNSYYRSNKKHVFLLPVNSSFKSQLTNIARGRPARQINTAHDGFPERAVDGNTGGIWWRNSVTHTHHVIDPFWEVDLQHDAVIEKVFIWNRIDCCHDRLSNVQVDVYDAPYGNVVETRMISGQAKLMNVVDFGGAPGQAIRITLKTGGARGILSLAEVEVEGTVGPSPTASPTRDGLTNVALASMGAVASNSWTCCGGDASRAIDGNTDGDWGSGSVTHTPHMTDPYWEVKLNTYYSISRVDVYNRVDYHVERIKDAVVIVYREGFKVYTSEPISIIKSFYSFKIPYIVGDKVQIMIPGQSKIVSLAEVMVMGIEAEWNGPTNVALASNGGIAYQSVTAHGGEASRANDGNAYGYWHGGSVTHTRGLTNPFWEVTLDAYYSISRVGVYNRVDCCSDRINGFNVTIYQGMQKAFSVQSSVDNRNYYDIEIPDIVGNRVEIMLPGSNRILSLAEVVVLGVEAEWTGPTLNNVALASNGAVAYQTSTTGGGVASRAIDGNKDGDWNKNSVAATSWQRNPYWEVKLDKFYSISGIYVYNRLDCCGDRINGFVLNIFRGGLIIYSVSVDSEVEHTYSIDIPNIIGDKVQILLPGNGRQIAIAEVMVDGVQASYDGPTNVALTSLGAVASQSQTAYGGDAARAIDGNTNGHWSYDSVTATSWMSDPYWQVALDTEYYISRVDVFNRDDCCSDRIKGFVLIIYKKGEEVFTVQSDSDVKNYYTFEIPDILGDVVKISVPGNTKQIFLAEVHVAGVKSLSEGGSLSQSVAGSGADTQSVYEGVIYEPMPDEVDIAALGMTAHENEGDEDMVSIFNDADPYPSDNFDEVTDNDSEDYPDTDDDPSADKDSQIIEEEDVPEENTPESYALDDEVTPLAVMVDPKKVPTASPTTALPTKAYKDLDVTIETYSEEEYNLDDTLPKGVIFVDPKEDATTSPTPAIVEEEAVPSDDDVPSEDNEDDFLIDDTPPEVDRVEIVEREPDGSGVDPETGDDEDENTEEEGSEDTEEEGSKDTEEDGSEVNDSPTKAPTSTTDESSSTNDNTFLMDDDASSNLNSGNETDCRQSGFLQNIIKKLLPF